MNIRRLAWLAAGTFAITLGGLGAAACSSDGGGTGLPSSGSKDNSDNSSSNGGGTSATGNGSGTGNTGGGGPGAISPTDAGTGGGNNTQDGGSSTGGGTCKNPKPPTLHAASAGVYCPSLGPNGAPGSCAAGETCCVNAVGVPSTCAATGACPSTTSFVWECDDNVHCGDGQVCCGIGAVRTNAACKYDEASKPFATKCKASCDSGDLSMCSKAQGQCADGTTCTPFKAFGKQLGRCK